MFYLREYEHVSDPKFIANLFMQGWGEERTIPHPNIYYRTKKDCRGNSSAVFFNQPILWFFVKFWGAKVSMHSWRGHALNTVRVLFRCVC